MPLPYWSTLATPRVFPAVDRDLHVDVVILGAGLTGLTTAVLLLMSGHKVVVLDRDRCGGVDTALTSAHLTMVTDERLAHLAKSLGPTHGQAVWDAGLAAIHQIETLASMHEIDCDFEWVPGFLHVKPGRDNSDQIDELRAEADIASQFGFDAEFVTYVPFLNVPGVRYDGQARFSPRKYVVGLANVVVRLGGQIFEHSEPEDFSSKPLGMSVNGHTVSCDDIVVATHNPTVGVMSIPNAAILQTKLALYTSYVIAAKVDKGRVPDALWWDTVDPYRFLRIDPQSDHDVVVFGGEDHKTGQMDDPSGAYDRLEQTLAELVPGAKVTHRWSGQVINTPDALPFIGRMADYQYGATGFCGNGMTFGTLGAMIVAETIAGHKSPWAELFSFDRASIRHGLWDYLKENADYPYYMIRDRFAGAKGKSLRSVKRGEGRIIEHYGKKVAAYRNSRGSVTLRSPVCTHLGCLVGWNATEKTWDCPCHGSRFKTNGEVMAGPAEAPLAEVED